MKNQNTSSSFTHNDAVDIRFIFKIWIRWIWILIPLILIGLFFGYRDLKNFSPLYEAKIVIDNNEGKSRQSSQINQLLFAFSNSETDLNTNLSRLRLILESPFLAERLQEKYNLLPEVFSESWDSKSGKWIVPSGKDFESSESRRAFFKQPNWTEPDIESLAGFISGSIEFEETDLGFIEVIFSHKEKDKAKKYLEMVYFEADSLIREKDQIYVNERLKYLLKKLNVEKRVDQRQILITLLKEEQNRIMLLDSSEPYAAKIIEPVYVSRTPTAPNIRFMFGLPIIISIFFGFMILTLYALFISESPNRR